MNSGTQKRALITGITGQDGSYLSEFLLDKGYEVYGLVRRSSNDPFVRMRGMPFLKDIKVLYGNLRDIGSIHRAMEESKPDEIYNLAAMSDVGISFKCPEESLEVNYHGLGRIVHEVLDTNLKIRIYQASTSEMFGKTPPKQNEKSLLQPVSPYGDAKVRAHLDYVVGYRERHGLHISSGILFNHESPRRGEHFVTRKITLSFAKIKVGQQEYVELGNLDAKRDWGFAGDYVVAMWRMLQQEIPDDYVIATGEAHTVREFVERAGRSLGYEITWEGSGTAEVGRDQGGVIRVKVNEKFYRPAEVDYLLGDSSKAQKVLGWERKVSFDELVSMMAKSDWEKVSSSISPSV